jgi:hypothetical protein
MSFATDDFSGPEATDIRSHFNDLTDELMTDDERDWNGFPGPRIPVVNVKVRPANASRLYPNQNVINAD